MSLRVGSSRLVRALVMFWSATLAFAVQGQAKAPPRMDNGVSRVLEIERVLGGANIERDGKSVALQPGFLLFNGERMTLMPGSRVDLRLLRYGDVHAIAGSSGGAHVVFEKLPFSSWAVDLSTHVRLETGVLRVRWARSGDAHDWPLAVLVDRWKAELANGEFLFRRDDRGMVSCSVSGKVDLVDDAANVRESLLPGRCLTFTRQGTTERTELSIAEWPELGVVLLREELDGPAPAERSLAIQQRQEGAPPIVAPPPPRDAAAASPEPTPSGLPPAPPRIPLSVAEESVQESTRKSASETPAPRVEPVPPPPAKAAIPPPPAPRAPAPAPAAAAPPPPSPAATAPSPSKEAATAAAPAPAAADAEAAESTAPSGPEWIVNVMTVTDPDAARQHVATLTSAGYPAMLRKEVVRGRTSYRVIIGGISNEQGARRMAQLLASKMGYTSAWPLQKR